LIRGVTKFFHLVALPAARSSENYCMNEFCIQYSFYELTWSVEDFKKDIPRGASAIGQALTANGPQMAENGQTEWKIAGKALFCCSFYRQTAPFKRLR
jgi:hypothetical protein